MRRMGAVLIVGLGMLGCTSGGGSSSSSSGGTASSSSSSSGGAVDAGTDAGPLIIDVATTECLSGRKWVGGQRSSALMKPGSNCVDCHDATVGAPVLVLAGTLYRDLHEPSDCTGLPGARIRVTDNDGTVFETTTNEVGNFFIVSDGGMLAPPYRAVLFGPDGGIRGMVTPQDSNSCNSCHAQQGRNAAPGRIQP